MTRGVRALTAVGQNRRLRRLALAFAGFNAAEWAVWIAMLVFAYDQGGATTAGLVAVAQLVPAALFAPFAATLTDRKPPARVLAGGYVTQALAMGATAVALYAHSSPVVAYALAAVAASAVTMTRPTQCALVPCLARRPEELTAANVVLGWVDSATVLLGPALAGILLGLGGAALVFAVMAMVVLGSAWISAGIDGPPAPNCADEADAVAGVAAGFRVVASEPNARLLVTLLSSQFVVLGALDVLFVVLAISVLELGQAGAGYLNAAFGLGGLLGIAATAALIGRRRLLPSMMIGLGTWALAFLGIAFGHSAAAAFLLLAAAGLGRSLFDVAGRTLLQRTAPTEVLGRVFGVLEGISMAALAVGSVLASLLVAGGGAKLAFVVMGALLPVIALLAGVRLRRVDAAADVPVVELSLLRAVALTAALPGPELERLARALDAVEVESGHAVFHKGDYGDRFYVIGHGEFDVLDGERVLNLLARGDAFGEIALLHDVPRTASVIAREQSTIYALERADFLAAVAGNPGFGRDTAALAQVRLAPDTTLAPAD